MASNYVRVGVRVRPPFEDEIVDEFAEAATGEWHPAVSVVDSASASAVVRLELGEKRAREFAYDYAFGPEASQREVFDTLAAPVVDDVVERGLNGTVFAYGQTGEFCLRGSGGGARPHVARLKPGDSRLSPRRSRAR